MIEPFLLRAFIAAAILAALAAPFGCLIMWNRMAYFGETIAHAGLIGVALALALQIDMTLAVLLAAIATASVILGLSRQRQVPVDSILGLMHHATLSIGLIAAALLAGPSVDLQAYLFGDIFAIPPAELYGLTAAGVAVLAALAFLWRPLLRLSVNPELAAAEGVPGELIRAAFTLLLAVMVALAARFVGILLVVSFLIVPAVAARPFASSPERMAAIAAAVGVAAAALGLTASAVWDLPGTPAIVAVMSLVAAASLSLAAARRMRGG